MVCNIYTCTACGAELAINGVESSTFCAYCGQPTIIFSRVSSEIKPKYILPFSVTKDQAVIAIRQKLKKGFFISNEIKNFDVERVRGIYIPYWLFDIHYEDKVYLSGTKGSGDNEHDVFFYREADCNFKQLTLDASGKLADESSQRLEPYDTHALQPFDISYLSGFYADRYDVPAEQLHTLAISRAENLFNAAIKDTVHANNVTIVQNAPERQILKADYAMLPAWFLTFRYQQKPYTILVNGQTGKVVGGVPYNKSKVAVCFILTGLAVSFFAFLIIYGLFLMDMIDSPGKFVFDVLIVTGIFVGIGIAKFHKVKKSVELTESKTTDSYVKDRQEGI
ncbi:putative uncharacterized protein [Clostridium sp. CAG:632]|nr:putative uncharacterized protein [Clostridium sp. CAG:632]